MARPFEEIFFDLLRSEDFFVSSENEILKDKVVDSAYKADRKLIELLLENTETKNKFFSEIKGHWVFNINDFVMFVQDKHFLNDSYTKYKNKIGLNVDGKFLNERKEVALVWPFKDTVLEGGMTKEDQKKKEIFFNEILAQDEIDKLLAPKVLTNWKRYTAKGEEEVKELKRDEDGTIKENLIIKGNNLLALHTLKEQFRGKVKLIYIDPPYNTGSDSFGYNDSFSHSTWLTFMKNRLEVAKELLRDDGAIFVQCDDNEQAYLKVLMDDVFDRNNFVNTISARMKNIAGASGGGEDKRLKKNIEFINIFGKNYNLLNLKNTYEYTEIYKLVLSYREQDISWKYTSVMIDGGKKEYVKSTKDGDGNEIKIYRRLKPVFKSVSQISKDEKISERDVYYKYIDKIFTTAMPQSSIRTRVLGVMQNKNDDFISIEYIPRSGKNKGIVYEQFYKGEKLRLLTWLRDVIENIDNVFFKKDLQGTLWDGFNLNNLSKEGEMFFESGKKPEDLVKKVVDISTEEGDIILDYHLGSGTTSAVAHKMNRQYIGVEQMDYIKNITTERLKKVIEGEQGGISKSVDWKGGGDFVYFELMKYNEDFVEQIKNAKDIKSLLKIWEQMKEKAFFKHNFEMQKFEKNIEEFKKLDLQQQKQVLFDILDKNQLYVNYSEIEDKKFKVEKKDQDINKEFYGK